MYYAYHQHITQVEVQVLNSEQGGLKPFCSVRWSSIQVNHPTKDPAEMLFAVYQVGIFNDFDNILDVFVVYLSNRISEQDLQVKVNGSSMSLDLVYQLQI